MVENNNLNTLINLNGLITFKNRIQSKIDTVTELVTTETTRAENAESVLQTNINSLNEKIEGLTHLNIQVVTTLPTATEDLLGSIYMMSTGTGTDGSAFSGDYIEYIVVNKGTTEAPVWAWERIGTTAVDLSGYVQGSVATDAEVRAELGIS